MACVGDPRQLEVLIGQRAPLDRAVAGIEDEAGQRRPVHGLAGAQALEVEVLDDAGVLVCAEVDDHLFAALERVDVMEGEAGLAGDRLLGTPGLAVDQREARAALGLPAVVLDVGPAGEGQRERVHDERELGQHDPVLREAEGVHVRRLGDRQAREHPRLRGRGVEAEEAVAAARAELGRVVDRPAGRAVQVRVGRRQLARRHVRRDLGRLERARVELHRQRRLGHRDEALAELHHVDVRVVGDRVPGREHRLHALEQRAAGIGGELSVRDPSALARGAVGAALQVAVAVGHAPAVDREAVEHRKAVEPVAHLRPAFELELGGTGAQQRAGEPGGQLARDGKLVEGGLVLECREAERGGGSGHSGSGHDHSPCMVRIERSVP